MNGSRRIAPRGWLLVVLAAVGCTPGLIKPHPPGVVPISDVVAAIQEAIDPFWQPKAGLPPISSVKIALQTVHDIRFSAEADYLIVALKGYYDHAATQEVDLTLVPQAPSRLGILGQDLSKELREAIASTQKDIQATYTRGGHTLNTQQIDVQISFAVTWDVNGGVNKWSIVPISVNASAETSVKTTNTVTVSFKKPTPPG